MTPYGKDVIRNVLIFTLALDLAAFFIPIVIVKLLIIAVSVAFFLFTLYFFRDPERNLPKGISEDTIISPADGKVVLIEDIINNEKNSFALGEHLKQISIFLSPLNVHVNRFPLTGSINFFKYVKGEYIVAFDHKASERNERTEIGIINKNSKQLITKQIAGFVARRIVCDLKEGDKAEVGERFGMIKFGSRMDIICKPDTKIMVEIGQKVVAGETIIAELQ